MKENLRKRKEFDRMLMQYPDVMTIEDMCEILGNINVKTGYKLLKSGKIKSVKAGRRYLIAKMYVIDFLMCQN